MARIRGGGASVLQEIGRAVAAAVTDPVARKQLLTNPEDVLTKAGIAPADLASKRLVVHEDSATTMHIVIPHELDPKRVGDADYLEELGRATLAQCKEPF